MTDDIEDDASALEEHGTPVHQLSMNGGPWTSRDAAEKLSISEWEALVLDAIRSFGEEGCIRDDLRKKFGGDEVPMTNHGARYGALLRDVYIERRGGTRKGELSNRRQLIFHRILPEERQRRLDAIAALEHHECSPEEKALIYDWYDANEALKTVSKIIENERLARDKVIEALFCKVLPEFGTGTIVVELGYRLKCEMRTRENSLSFLPPEEPKPEQPDPV